MRKVLYTVSALRDVCGIAVGVLCLMQTPPSLDLLFENWGFPWALMITGGSLMSLVGQLFRHLSWEFIGVLVYITAASLWALAAVLQPAPTAVSGAVAVVLIQGVLFQVYRLLMLYNGRVAR